MKLQYLELAGTGNWDWLEAACSGSFWQLQTKMLSNLLNFLPTNLLAISVGAILVPLQFSRSWLLKSESQRATATEYLRLGQRETPMIAYDTERFLQALHPLRNQNLQNEKRHPSIISRCLSGKVLQKEVNSSSEPQNPEPESINSYQALSLNPHNA